MSQTTAVAVAPTVDQTPATVDKRVEQYIKVRDALKKMDEEHDERRKPLVELQNLLTGWMQTFMENAGADNIKTSHGTCYSSTRYTASLADPEAFMNYVKSTGNYDLLDRKANVTACRDFVAENNSPPPGVNLSAIKTVGVRRATGK